MKTVRLETLIEKSHVKYSDFDGDEELEAFGVSNTEGITRTAHRKSDDLGNYLVIEPGSFAYNPYRINVGSIGLTPAGLSGVVSPAYIVFRAKEGKLIPEVLLDFLKSSEGLRQINKLARGAVRKALRYDDLCEIQFPEISYERQISILQHKQGFNLKYSQLNQEIAHQKSLLTNLKQAILQEAIRGNLTEDWRAANPVGDLSTEASAKVEPASQLLKRIQAEKDRLIADKKLRKEKPLPKITPDEIPFEIPEGWEWCRVGAIGSVKVGATPKREVGEYWSSEVPWVSSGEVANNLITESRECISQKAVDSTSAKVNPAGSVLVAMIGQGKTRGQTAILQIDAATNQNVAAIRLHGSVSSEYIWLNFLARYEETRSGASGGNQPALNGIKIRNSLIPLPPLAEQAATVERVESLMTTCQALEAEIVQSRTHAAHLLQAVLKEAFAK